MSHTGHFKTTIAQSNSLNCRCHCSLPHRPPVEENVPLRNGAPYSTNSDIASSSGRPKRRRDYDDYNSSGDELDDDDFDR